MGSNEGEENRVYNKSRCILSLSFLISIALAGGFVLGWWLHKYHPNNRQLWMVPFGFLLFITPLIICLSVILPDLSFAKTTAHQTADPPLPHSLSQLNK